MLAKVPLDHATVEQADATAAPPSFTATLNLDPTTFTNMFSLTAEIGGENTPVANLVPITENNQEISITLVGATFANPTIEWLLPPTGVAPPNPPAVNNVITFRVPQPVHGLTPWAFRIVVNTATVNGIRSQAIFLIKPVSSESDPLQYDASNGNFILPGGDTRPQPVILVNAGVPDTSTTYSVNLVTSSVPTGTSINFADPPVVWSTEDAAPDWVKASRLDAQNITLTILSGGGQTVGLRFAIEITAEGTTTAVLSPDPILVNATIGDG